MYNCPTGEMPKGGRQRLPLKRETASWVMEATQEVATSEEEIFTTWEKQG